MFKRPARALFLVIVVLTGERLPAGPGEESGRLGSLVGTVTAGGVPARGAEVVVEGTASRATSDGLGRFRLDGVPAGGHAVRVSAPGFVVERRVEVAVRGGDATTLLVELVPSPNFMERVLVTATRQAVASGELPALTNLVERADFELRNDQRLVQAIDHVPGLVASTQAGSFESVTLRGLPRDGNEFTTTLLLVDGIPQTDSRNSARVVNLPIDDAATIEVLRGPNSSLYGRTAIGGTVNLLTAEPTARHHAGVEATAGEFVARKTAARVSGPAAGWGGYYLGGSFDRNEGPYSGPADYEAERWAAFGKLTFAPGKRTYGVVTANRVRSDQSTPTNVPVIGGRLLSDLDPRFDRLANLNLPGPNYHQAEDRTSLSATRQVGSATTLVALLGYRDVRYQFIDDGDVIGSPFDLARGTLTMYPFEQQTDERIAYSELRLELAPGSSRRDDNLLVGGSYERTSGFVAGNLIYTDEDLLGWTLSYLEPRQPARAEWQFFPIGGDDYHLRSSGGFTQYRVAPTDRVTVIAGLRYDRFALDNTRTRTAGRPRIDDSFDALSPKLGVTWQLEDRVGGGLSLFLSYAEAFVPPRRPSQLRPSKTPVELEPEDVDNVELGIKGTSFGGKLSYQAAAFGGERDGIVVNVRRGPFFLPSNAGEHDYRGLEAEARYTPRGGLSFYANLAHYHNRFGRFVIESASGDTVLTGNRLPIAPDRVWNAGVRARLHRTLDLVANVKHVGPVAIDQGNTFELDSYALVDLALAWQRAAWGLTVSAHNLLAEEYWGNGDTSSGETADPGRPRQLLLSASWHWPGR